MESSDSRIPKKAKKVGWSDKHCALCEKHGDHTGVMIPMTVDVFNKAGTPIKKNGGGSRLQHKEKGCEWASFAQTACTECREVHFMQSCKHNKHFMNDSESNDDSK